MLLFFREFEAMFLVDAPGGVEHAVGPQYELLVATVAGEAYALSDEARTETSPAGFWLHEEEPELRNLLALANDEDATDVPPARLGDPTALPGRVVPFDKVGHDPRNERLEAFVPAVLSGVERTVALDHPTHVTGLVPTQEKRLGRSTAAPEDLLDGPCRIQEPALVFLRNDFEHSRHLLP